jgi:enamine deaminase RidA (YjgF/YER057c/UK114 family)
MRPRRLAALFLLLLFLAGHLFPTQAQRRRGKKDEEPVTQTLQLPPDPPLSLKADAARIGFRVAPLSPRGLLSQQVRDGLRRLLSDARGARIVKIRAFVAGTGDIRRVQAIVSEEFSERKLPLPVLSVIQTGGLPLEAAQVQLEAMTEERKPVNPAGIAFISGQDITSPEPRSRVVDLARKSLAQLQSAATAAAAPEMLRVACFTSSLDDAAEVQASIAAAFPKAAGYVVRTQRAPAQSVVECEGVARLSNAPDAPVKLLNPPGLRASPNYSQVALVGPVRLVLAGTQLAFRYTEDDARLAFQRLEKTLAAEGASLKNAVMLNTYPLSPLLADLVRKVRFDYLDPARPPASTMLPFEGLPSMDAAFGLEVVALAAAPGSSSQR